MTIPADTSKLRDILEQMLASNATVTARAVIRERGSPFKHASDITRNAPRRVLLEEFQQRQQAIRQLAADVDRESVSSLRLRVARLEEACADLRRSRDLLAASHKAMILAVGEAGGMRAWIKFFPQWDEVRKSLMEMDAIPDRSIPRLTGTERIPRAK